MKHPAYHLRTNKAVDRLTLVSQIKAVLVEERAARYFSLAGPFLEDARLVHSAFPTMKLVSIESNRQTFKRQNFHKFVSARRLTLVNNTFDNYLIHAYEPGKQDIFWLDYTDLKPARLNEFRDVITKAPSKSLVRLTLNAEPDRTLNEIRDLLTEEQRKGLEERAEAAFLADFERVMSHDGARSPFCSSEEFARTVQLMVRRVVSEALDVASGREFLHLSSTRYEDGVQMVSVTGVVCDRGSTADLQAGLKAKGHIALSSSDWPAPSPIEMPVLSQLERHRLDRLLPRQDRESVGDALYKKLGYHIDSGERRSKEALRQYARHFLEYPTFIKSAQ